MVGKIWSPEEVIDEILKDRLFYEESGGGVTFSGGEPLHQTESLCELLRRCREKGIHTAVDTCGYAPSEQVEEAAALTDLWLFDLKHTDSTKHTALCGVSNREILENLEMLVRKQAEILIRIPLIPGINDDEGNLRGILAVLRKVGPSLKGIQLLPYHPMAKRKYERLNLPYTPLEDLPEQKKELWYHALNNLGYPVFLNI